MKLLKEQTSIRTIVVKTVIAPGLLFKKEDLEEMADLIKGLKCTWILKGFDNERTLDKNLKNINKPSFDFLMKLKEHLETKNKELIIEVVE